MKTCSVRKVVRGPQAPTMRFNDGAADAKPHAGAVRLRCKKRVEDLVRLLWGKPYTCIADGHQNLFFLRSLRLDGQLARPIHFLHRIDAVHDEIHQYLLQLHTISHDPRKICGEVHPDCYVVSRCLAAQEDYHLSNGFVYVHELPLRSTLLE